jgi:hypothetical protein
VTTAQRTVCVGPAMKNTKTRRRKMIRRRLKRANDLRAAEDNRPVRQREKRWEPPGLRFSPTAWAKLLYWRDLGDTEVGGFGIAAADNLLVVDDVALVRQTASIASVTFNDLAVANFFDEQVDKRRRPEQFGRIWVHTHPGHSPEPSMTDDETFCRVFGRTDWAVMFILARGGQSYARLRFNIGPGGEVDLPVTVDYSRPFARSDHAGWKEQYDACVEAEPIQWPDRGLASPLDAGLLLEPLDDRDLFFDLDDRPTARGQLLIDNAEDCYVI